MHSYDNGSEHLGNPGASQCRLAPDPEADLVHPLILRLSQIRVASGPDLRAHNRKA